jgi:hypothetical protein
VLAEGSEDVAALEALRRMGCDTGQGYYFAHPIDAGDFERWRIRYHDNDGSRLSPPQSQRGGDEQARVPAGLLLARRYSGHKLPQLCRMFRHQGRFVVTMITPSALSVQLVASSRFQTAATSATVSLCSTELRRLSFEHQASHFFEGGNYGGNSTRISTLITLALDSRRLHQKQAFPRFRYSLRGSLELLEARAADELCAGIERT